jgi:F-type H+-transporting ATPase subunit epsilon
MAETMQFDLVSPERSLVSTSVTSVQIPGADGDMTAMPNHAPLITTLRPGILSVMTQKGTDDYVVTGGFAEIGDGLTILAESAMSKADLDQATFDRLHAEAVEVAGTAKTSDIAGAVDEAAKLLSDLNALAAAAGLQTR